MSGGEKRNLHGQLEEIKILVEINKDYPNENKACCSKGVSNHHLYSAETGQVGKLYSKQETASGMFSLDGGCYREAEAGLVEAGHPMGLVWGA